MRPDVQEMETGFFEYFCTATAGFVFSTHQQDIPDTITGESHEREVLFLINQVRSMAVKKSMHLPESFVADCDRDDWIQLAMITMFECCEKYDRKRPFDNFVRFMVSRRLADRQRSLLRKNPPVDREIMSLYHELKKTSDNEKAITQLAEDTNKSVEELNRIVAAGVGPRVFTSELTVGERNEQAQMEMPDSNQQTPEQNIQERELRRILIECMNKLSEKSRHLFHLHEFEELSFKKIFSLTEYTKSFASFKRWYKSDIFDKVQDCVLTKAY